MAYTLTRIKRKDLKFVKTIGEGNFSTVFLTIWKGKEVACKRLNKVDDERMKILSELDHPNIVKLLGVVDENFDFFLISELCKGGSLRPYLDAHKEKPLPQFYDWAKQVARPLQYLRQKDIPHKDVNSLDYMISDDNILKLADFGMTKNKDSIVSKATMSKFYPWLAPELLKEGNASPKHDIYTYGMMLYELWTRLIPFHDIPSHKVIWRVCKDNEHPTMPSDIPEPLAELLMQCWDQDWQKRPDFDRILSVLETTEQEMKSMKEPLADASDDP